MSQSACRRVVIEGWRFIPHSYALVAQSHSLCLLRRRDIELRFADLPYYDPRWRPTRGIFAPAQEDALAALGNPEPTFIPDVTLTFRPECPAFEAPAYGRRLAFATAELRVLTEGALGGFVAGKDVAESVSVLTPSRWSALAFERFGMAPSRVHVVPHGVDPDVLRPDAAARAAARAALGFDRAFVFLSVGAMTWNKGLDVLLAAFSRVAQTDGDVRLFLKGADAIYGSANMVREVLGDLPARAREIVASKLMYRGESCSAREMANLLRAADVYVSPYRAEGFNLPVLEAAACGTPIICTAGGPTDEFMAEPFTYRIRSALRQRRLDAKTVGDYLEPDVDHLVEHMREALRERDVAARRGVAAAAYVAQNLTWERVTDRLVEIFRDPPGDAPVKASAPAAANDAGTLASKETAVAADTAFREALAAWQRGDGASALARCRAALACNDASAKAWTLLGIIMRRGNPVAAESALRRASALDPRDPDPLFHLGNLHREQGQFVAAADAYRSALALAPRHTSILNNLGMALQGDNDVAGAESAYRAALEIDPYHRQSLRNLAHLLCACRRFEQARPLLDAYLQRHGGNDVDVWIDRGIASHHVGDQAGADEAFRRALALAPGDALILTNLGTLLVDRADHEQALPVLAQAVANDPNALYAVSLLAYCKQHLCDWTGLEALHARIVRAVEADPNIPVNVFAALSTPLDAGAQLRVAQRWARDLVPQVPESPPPAAATISRPRPRLGYVSSDFGTHPIAFLLCEIWERHNRARFETFAYSIGPREDSPLRSRIEAAFENFIDCGASSSEDIARRIRADDIDLLIDLNGYTTHARSEIFALRPGRVQLSWLGYLGTLGARWYDYVITDRFITPEDQQALFTERFLYLPDCYCPSDTRRSVAPAAPSRVECQLPDDGFVFCCFNNTYKLLPTLFDVWMRLVSSVPGSVLWLSPTSAVASANLRRAAAARGVAPERLVFAPRIPVADHLARHARADLFLDTLPYNAGTTANDALFMGLPVLTTAGATMAGRVAASQLHAIGLPELVTRNLREYEALALALARDAKRLSGLRARLAANRSTYPLFDMARFVVDLEDRLAGARIT